MLFEVCAFRARMSKSFKSRESGSGALQRALERQLHVPSEQPPAIKLAGEEAAHFGVYGRIHEISIKHWQCHSFPRVITEISWCLILGRRGGLVYSIAPGRNGAAKSKMRGPQIAVREPEKPDYGK
jgi:hypothetical protein